MVLNNRDEKQFIVTPNYYEFFNCLASNVSAMSLPQGANQSNAVIRRRNPAVKNPTF